MHVSFNARSVSAELHHKIYQRIPETDLFVFMSQSTEWTSFAICKSNHVPTTQTTWLQSMSSSDPSWLQSATLRFAYIRPSSAKFLHDIAELVIDMVTHKVSFNGSVLHGSAVFAPTLETLQVHFNCRGDEHLMRPHIFRKFKHEHIWYSICSTLEWSVVLALRCERALRIGHEHADAGGGVTS